MSLDQWLVDNADISQSHKDLPHQFLTSSKPITASIVIGSFGSSTPYKSKAFDLQVTPDPNSPVTVPEAPLRYAAETEIHHIFRADPKSPPKIITIVFAAAVAAALPVLFGVWAALGANTSHLSKALSDAPVSHALFYGSILHQLESVPDSARCRHCRFCCVLEWKQGFD
jgi:oligosaccharyltransferase complex subunit delta (ribophorin II)